MGQRDILFRTAEGKGLDIEFSWLDLAALHNVEVYPSHAREKLIHLAEHIEQFVFVEEPTPPG